ncbi:MAG: DUF58 domain-containing protein [Granulosicoccus sp.]
MSLNNEEFVYRLPVSSSGTRPGAHRGLSRGSGMNFAAHAKLFDVPDPRRLDLRASISDVRGDWLVRTYLQPASINIHVLLDMSASMQFGEPGKLQVAANFLNSLGISAHSYGDAISLLPFDETFREDLYQPPRRGRAIGAHMAKTIQEATTAIPQKSTDGTPTALQEAVSRIEGQSGLVFLLSDFHWGLDTIDPLLDKLANATLVPIIIWDKTEVTPPEAGQLLFARDLKKDHRRQLWVSEPKREQWIANVQAQRQKLTDLFARHNSSPFFIESSFNAEQLSRYFTEHVT